MTIACSKLTLNQPTHHLLQPSSIQMIKRVTVQACAEKNSWSLRIVFCCPTSKPLPSKVLDYLVFEDSLLVFEYLVLLHKSLILYLSPPPVLSIIQWEIPLCSLQTHIAHFLQFKFQGKLYIFVFIYFNPFVSFPKTWDMSGNAFHKRIYW